MEQATPVVADKDLKSTIIEFMRDRPFLWNMKDPMYKDTKRRESEFELFSEQLKLPVKEIKRVWHVLRTNFFRAHKILIEKPPDCDGQDKLWKYYQSMTYILPIDYHMQHTNNNTINIHDGTICNNFTNHDCSNSRQGSPGLGHSIVTEAKQQRRTSTQNSDTTNNTMHANIAIDTTTTNSNYDCNSTSPHRDCDTQIQAIASVSAANQFVIVNSDNLWGSATAHHSHNSDTLKPEPPNVDGIAISSMPRAKRVRKSNSNIMDNCNNSAGISSANKYSIPTAVASKSTSEHSQPSADLLLGDLKDDDELYARALACSLRKFDPTTKEIVKLKFQEIIVKYMQQRRQRLYIVPRTVDSKSTS